LQAKEIKDKLNLLIEQSSGIDQNLTKRLRDIQRWIRNLKLGTLASKPIVIAFLLEVITDSKVWLAIQSLPSEEAKRLELEQMSANERYWYGYLFPKWINATDTKFYIWKKKMMAGEFNQADSDIIKYIAQEIVNREGDIWQRYIADLSMATDLIVSHHQRKPLCIQVTSLREQFHNQKYQKWQNALQLWEIERGLFLSYDPSESDFIRQLVNVALYNSDHLAEGKYLNFS